MSKTNQNVPRESADLSEATEQTGAHDRRTFLRRLAGTAAATPLFFTAGARAEESSAFERATDLLVSARQHLDSARAAAGERREESLEAASLEVKKAEREARSLSGAERREISTEIRSVKQEIAELEG